MKNQKLIKRIGIFALTLALLLTAVGCAASTGPYIGEDGYWYVDGQKTDFKAAGQDGKDGKDDVNGRDGANGTAAVPGGAADDPEAPIVETTTKIKTEATAWESANSLFYANR